MTVVTPCRTIHTDGKGPFFTVVLSCISCLSLYRLSFLGLFSWVICSFIFASFPSVGPQLPDFIIIYSHPRHQQYSPLTRTPFISNPGTSWSFISYSLCRVYTYFLFFSPDLLPKPNYYPLFMHRVFSLCVPLPSYRFLLHSHTSQPIFADTRPLL